MYSLFLILFKNTLMCVLKRKTALPNSGVDKVQYLFQSHLLFNWFNIDSFPMGILGCNQLCKSKQKTKFQTVYFDSGHSMPFVQVNTYKSQHSLPE